MRLAVLVERRNQYRLLGPVVDAALARGWDAECWHDVGQPRGFDFPGAPPPFRHGTPRVRAYRGGAGLAAQLAATPPEAVIAFRRPAGLDEPRAVRWFGLQYTLNVQDLVDCDGSTRFAGVGLHSPHWRQDAAGCIEVTEFNRSRATGTPARPVDGAAVEATLARCGRFVGVPELDLYERIDPEEVRRRYGIARGRPVVVYIPFQFRSLHPDPERPGRAFWLTHVNPHGRLRQQLAVWLHGRPEYQPYVDRRWCDRGVVAAVRAFCDANDAVLVVKPKLKDRVPRYLRRRADRVVWDRDYYPPAILDVLRIASLCVITCLSTVTYEAAYAGVPSVTVAPTGDELGFRPVWQERFLHTRAGGSFHFPGVVYPVSLGDFVDGFARRRLADYPVEPAARIQYVEKFIGFDDGKSSERVLDAVREVVEAPAERSAAARGRP